MNKAGTEEYCKKVNRKNHGPGMQQGKWKMIIIISSCYIQSYVVRSASITAMENPYQYRYCKRERLGRGKRLSEKVYNEVWVQWTKIEWITEVRGYPSSTAILVEPHSLSRQSLWDRDITAVYMSSSYLLPHGYIPAAWPRKMVNSDHLEVSCIVRWKR